MAKAAQRPEHRAETDHQMALGTERRAQIRALLLLALVLLLFLLFRAGPLHLFNPGWWRI